MKLTFKKILKEVDQSIEDWSTEIEGGEETPQQKAQRIQTNQQTPQQVQGTSGVKPATGNSLESIAKSHGVNPQHLTALLKSAMQGVTPQIYSQLQSLVGDMENLMIDLEQRQPQLYAQLVRAGLGQASAQNSQNFAPAANKPINQMSMKFPTVIGQNPNPNKYNTPAQIEKTVPRKKIR